jgi:hypothetical protein
MDGLDSTLFHTGLERLFRAACACDRDDQRPKFDFLVNRCLVFIFLFENNAAKASALAPAPSRMRALDA